MLWPGPVSRLYPLRLSLRSSKINPRLHGNPESPKHRLVDDQEKALRFYTEKLGFVKKADMPMGPFRWLTVVAPEGAEGVELVLNPGGFPPSDVYQKAKFAAGIPSNGFITRDIQAEYRRLKERGVVFRGEPTRMGPITAVLFEDTCGNLINLVQPLVLITLRTGDGLLPILITDASCGTGCLRDPGRAPRGPGRAGLHGPAGGPLPLAARFWSALGPERCAGRGACRDGQTGIEPA